MDLQPCQARQRSVKPHSVVGPQSGTRASAPLPSATVVWVLAGNRTTRNPRADCWHWEEDPMAITIFLALNGLAIAFLLYVLANFWKEGHPPKNDSRPSEARAEWRDWADVAVITHPISPAARGGLAVIPFAVTGREISMERRSALPAGKTRYLAAKRLSTK
jgi:hypothetical protein